MMTSSIAFNQQVWNLCRKIPKGKVSTYKEMAEALNSKAYRAVGNALNKNTKGAWTTKGSEMIPCHRVVNSDGRIRGFAKGFDAKKLLLEKDGVKVIDGCVDLNVYNYSLARRSSNENSTPPPEQL
ncbi:MGMT family protein [Candidatus Woesearchaeota archaeon]|nr:MGMT family protein [Candidatus Woesearchaeota archaeon]